jgi:uncharacterized membrane protein YcaP (DUF421 family)
MGSDDIIQAIIGVFIISVFLSAVIPALGKTTGSDMTITTLGLILLMGAIILGVIVKR